MSHWSIEAKVEAESILTGLVSNDGRILHARLVKAFSWGRNAMSKFILFSTSIGFEFISFIFSEPTIFRPTLIMTYGEPIAGRKGCNPCFN